MTVDAQPIRMNQHSQRRFFMAGTLAGIVVFAALATMLASITFAYSPLPAESLVRVSAGHTGTMVAGIDTRQ